MNLRTQRKLIYIASIVTIAGLTTAVLLLLTKLHGDEQYHIGFDAGYEIGVHK